MKFNLVYDRRIILKFEATGPGDLGTIYEFEDRIIPNGINSDPNNFLNEQQDAPMGKAVIQEFNTRERDNEFTLEFLKEECGWEVNEIFLDEKIWKPIYNHHPFIFVGCSNLGNGSLKELRKQGFKTFHPYIDESYDEEPDGVKRLHMVMEQVNKLCSMELSELHKLHWSMSDILIYNYEVYHKMVQNNYKDSMVYIVDKAMGLYEK